MSATLAENATGLRLLHEATETRSDAGLVDIIAVHGIGAAPDHTWSRRVVSHDQQSNDGDFINWLQDERMLPKSARKACILRFGYESKWFGEGALYTKLMDVAKKLLVSLCRHRKTNPGRPMVFVCHCYGGLVVLQALLAARSHPQEWPGIYESTTGLMFFGTPFRGAPGMNQVEMLEAARLAYSDDKIQPETLRILQSGNETLLNLVNEFCQVRQHRMVMCFYETKPSSVGRLFGRQDITHYIVDDTSGCLDPSPGIKSYPLSRNHFDMNKFSDPHEDDYLQVKDVLEDMINQAPVLLDKSSQSTETEMTFRSRRATNEGENGVKSALFMQWNIPRYTSGSFVGRTDVLEDLEQKLSGNATDSQRRYVITGVGGMGKSEICLRFIDKARDRFNIIAWIDVSTKVGAEKSLMDLAGSRGLHTSDLSGARNSLASISGNHLIILDNADNLKEDYQQFVPPSKSWNVIITSRNTQCKRHSSVGYWQIQSLGTSDSLKLLLTAAEIPEDEWSAKEKFAKDVVDCLGSHTLALIQAGSYIRARRCTLTEYPEIFRKRSRKLLEYPLTQAGSRYSDVWATFEVTSTALDFSKQSDADAQRLLDTLSMLHFTNFPTEVFEHTWKEARRVITEGLKGANTSEARRVLFEGLAQIARTRSLGPGREYLKNAATQGVFRLLVDEVADFLPILSAEWDSDRIHDALDVLADLALIQRSETKDGKLTISMHKLTHQWARERIQDPLAKRKAWLRAGSTIVLSNSTSWIWADPEIQLRPHARYFADNSKTLDISEVQPDMAEKIILFCAELLQMLREDEMLEQFLDKVIQELEKQGKSIKNVSLPLCKVRAKNLYDLSRVNEAVKWWTDIVETEKKQIKTTRTDRLESQHQLSRAMFLQGQDEAAVELLRTTVKECQSRLDETSAIRLAAEHDYADFCGLKGDREAAIKLFTHVINVRSRVCKETQAELLISQHQLARTYLHDGQIDEAFTRFEYVFKIRQDYLPETHPERLATQHELGCCYRESGQLDKAIENLEYVVKIRKQTLAPDNIEGCLSQMELATTYIYNKQVEKAKEILTHVVEMQKSLLDTSANKQGAIQLLDFCHALEDGKVEIPDS